MSPCDGTIRTWAGSARTRSRPSRASAASARCWQRKTRRFSRRQLCHHLPVAQRLLPHLQPARHRAGSGTCRAIGCSCIRPFSAEFPVFVERAGDLPLLDAAGDVRAGDGGGLGVGNITLPLDRSSPQAAQLSRKRYDPPIPTPRPVGSHVRTRLHGHPHHRTIRAASTDILMTRRLSTDRRSSGGRLSASRNASQYQHNQG